MPFEDAAKPDTDFQELLQRTEFSEKSPTEISSKTPGKIHVNTLDLESVPEMLAEFPKTVSFKPVRCEFKPFPFLELGSVDFTNQFVPLVRLRDNNCTRKVLDHLPSCQEPWVMS